MFRSLFFCLAMLFLSPVSVCAEGESHKSSAAEMLKAADDFRNSSASTRVRLEVLLYQQNELDSKKSYTVYIKENHRSLALFNSPGEQGQKALQLDDRFYLLLPDSRRPVRISPMQKLLGEAAIGDISTMTWSEDYMGKVLSEGEVVDETSTIKLELTSKQSDMTYERIELWIAQNNFRPIQAKLYLSSGRIAKMVSYRAGEMNGKEMITLMVMQDRIQKNKRTEIKYQSIEDVDVPDRYFNPTYLVRNHVE